MTRAKVIRINAILYIPHDDSLADTGRAIVDETKLRESIGENKAVVIEKWNAVDTSVLVSK